jgi:hypothetical protein
MRCTAAARAVAIASLIAARLAAAEQPGDGYDGTMFALYGWLPGVSSDLRYQLPSGSADTKSTDSPFQNLAGALMLQAAGHYGEWGWFADFDWVSLSGENARFRQVGGENIGGSLSLNTKRDLSAGLITFAGSYNLYHSNEGFGDLLFGGRYMWVSSTVKWDFGASGNGGLDIANSGKIDRNENLWAAVLGLRGRWRFGDGGRWYVPYYVDAGAGSSLWTSEVGLGVGYAFDWGEINVDYRDVRYHQTDNSALVRRLGLSGPTIKFAWYF